MTTNYHTPIPEGAEANAETFNNPLGQMDEALSEALLAERDGHIIQDEGVDLAQQPRLNFAGAGVTVTNDAGGNKTVVTIPGNGHSIEFEGSDITQRDDLNFTGDAVHVSDSGGKTVVDINHKMSDGEVGNYQISTSIASNNLTVALKEMSGGDPSTTSPVLFRSGNSKLKVTSALSVTITAAMGDIFNWDGRKIQGYDAQLFVYLINNNGTPQIGVSPCPALTTVATNYYDLGTGAQTGSASYRNMVMSGTRHSTNSCRVIGRVNVNQLDNNNWQNPTTALVMNMPIFETDWLNYLPAKTGFSTVANFLPCLYKLSKTGAEVVTAGMLSDLSNSVNFSMELPVAAPSYPNSLQFVSAGAGYDSGAFVLNSIARVNSGSTSALFCKAAYAGADWTASGQKSWYGTIRYGL